MPSGERVAGGTFFLSPGPSRTHEGEVVLLARTREQTEGGERELSLVDIRRAC
ncbi:MAG TPA: hypothetical protein VGC87_23840 [Pyrinomonadaceae bacterium]